MGITNFVTYVEKALKWPSHRYECNIRPEEKAVGVYVGTALGTGGVNYLRTEDGHDDRQAETTTDGARGTRYFDDVFGLFRESQGVTGVGDCPTVRVCGQLSYGISVDLSSFCYGVIADFVASDREEGQCTPPERGSADDDPWNRAKRPKLKSDAFGESLLRERASNSASSNDQNQPVLVSLDSRSVAECTKRCFDKIYNVIGHDTINDAHYFTLHYDKNTTSCKWHVQYKRRSASQTIIDKDSICQVYQDVIRMVRSRMVFDLGSHVQAKLDGSVDYYRREGAIVAPMVLAESGNSMLEDFIAEKMQLSHNGGSGDGFGDQQRFSFGEGEWMCFYGIRDVECMKADSNDDTRLRWYVFGNDADIGLGALLYTTESTRIHYVNNSRIVVSPPTEVCVREDLNAYKTLHFLSLCLVGNDYVPRLVNESARNMSALGDEVDRMISSDEHHCVTSVKRLSGVFSTLPAKKFDEKCDTAEDADDRSGFARAFAYVVARLLLAVYRTPDTQNTDTVEQVLSVTHTRPDVQRSSGHAASLRCKDGKHRTFEECFEMFALRTLWYLSYCIFYMQVDHLGRRRFQTDRAARQTFPLRVTGLPVKRCFVYNEKRLFDGTQFELSNLVDVRQTIMDISTSHLLHVLETRVMDVLEK